MSTLQGRILEPVHAQRAIYSAAAKWLEDRLGMTERERLVTEIEGLHKLRTRDGDTIKRLEKNLEEVTRSRDAYWNDYNRVCDREKTAATKHENALKEQASRYETLKNLCVTVQQEKAELELQLAQAKVRPPLEAKIKALCDGLRFMGPMFIVHTLWRKATARWRSSRSAIG